MVTDTIGDYLTRIRNAQLRKKRDVTMPTSKMLVALSKILKEEGFIEDFVEEDGETETQKNLVVTLRYINGKGAIRGLERISKPGVRQYVGYRKVPRILKGLGIAILTTSKGVMSGESAQKEKIGGEYLCKVW